MMIGTTIHSGLKMTVLTHLLTFLLTASSTIISRQAQRLIMLAELLLVQSARLQLTHLVLTLALHRQKKAGVNYQAQLMNLDFGKFGEHPKKYKHVGLIKLVAVQTQTMPILILDLYYKFNEGITLTSSTDKNVLGLFRANQQWHMDRIFIDIFSRYRICYK